MNTSIARFTGLALTLSITMSGIAHAANAPAWVDSKEYKVLVDPARFNQNPQQAADRLINDLSVRLQQLDFDKPLEGSFKPDGEDTVRYYDTPRTCLFRNSGYSVRIRTGDTNDIQLKYRNPDEELSAATDVSGNGADRKTKLETDISPGNLVYSHSTSQAAPSTPPLNIHDVINQFPGAEVFADDGLQWLAVVGGIDIHQVEYAGPQSDIGKSTAKFTVSLWYVQDESTPALAELSFKIKADDSSYFTTPVLHRSQVLMHAMSTLDGWSQPDSMNKTTWIYNYRSTGYPNGFCSDEGSLALSH